ncbi:hypothetical protein LQ361_22095 [Vibrio parahaemolyticus]|nr:hypothetical protein [Vibrio furnissii]MCD2151922.1 hypothetical protein [Vibrio parahaemolyticus]
MKAVCDRLVCAAFTP